MSRANVIPWGVVLPPSLLSFSLSMRFPNTCVDFSLTGLIIGFFFYFTLESRPSSPPIPRLWPRLSLASLFSFFFCNPSSVLRVVFWFFFFFFFVTPLFFNVVFLEQIFAVLPFRQALRSSANCKSRPSIQRGNVVARHYSSPYAFLSLLSEKSNSGFQSHLYSLLLHFLPLARVRPFPPIFSCQNVHSGESQGIFNSQQPSAGGFLSQFALRTERRPP